MSSSSLTTEQQSAANATNATNTKNTEKKHSSQSKKQSQDNPNQHIHDFCISDFNIIEQASKDEYGFLNDDSESDNSANTDATVPVFHIQIFSKNMKGEDASILVDDFEPFFYIKVPDSWKGKEKANFFAYLKSKIPKSLANGVTGSSLKQSQKLYGYDNGKKYNFMIVRFSNMTAYNKAKNLWYEYAAVDETDPNGPKERRLRPNGLIYGKANLILYEANIPPVLRYLHIRNISPSGWIYVDVGPDKAIQNIREKDKKTHCMHEYVAKQKHVVPIPGREQRPPFIKKSFDIEASSSHGDFPIPIKNYKKVASQMLELILEITNAAGTATDNNQNQITATRLETMIRAVFETPKSKTCTTSSISQLDIVFPKKTPTEKELDQYISKWLTTTVSKYSTSENIKALKNNNIMTNMFGKNFKRKEDAKNGKNTDNNNNDNGDDNDDDNDNDDDEIDNNSGGGDGDNDNDNDNKENEMEIEVNVSENTLHNREINEKLVQYSKKNKTIVDVLNDPTFSKEGKLTELTLSLDNAFPALEGDIVTFVGSTFLREGEKECYLNHCIVLNTCDRLPTPKSQVEVYDTEREVLLAWTRLMHRENPDIILGYNIFGFDYEFMFRRAQECECVEEFLTLSRNKGELCAQWNERTNKHDIERSSITISTGTYDLSIIKIPGRLQVDMLNYFRRTMIMSSYKLDNVASQIIGDEVLGKEYVDKCAGTDINIDTETGIVRCQTKNMTGISVGNWVHFMLENHSTQYFNGGQKYCICNINREEKWFEIEGLNEEEMQGLTAQKIKWGLAKDDVSPKDIFRLTHEGPAERMIVAKYCIQDCNLVHHLFNKVDVLTGLSEMAKLCSVPMSYLVFRGQGIKLTSFLAKKCREKNVLMPVINKGNKNDAYEGAVVLFPKTGIYLDDGAAVGDFASLYPSGMRSDNLCMSTKVWAKYYDLKGVFLRDEGEKNADNKFIYDNLPGRKYVDVPSNTYRWLVNPAKPKAAPKKVLTGMKICRFEQTEEGILPSILKELLQARKDTRKRIPTEPDPFMKQILDQRQLAYKVTANSIYGQTGAKTSTFYEPDVAASTTAIGRKCLTFAKRIIEECYGDEDILMTTKEDGDVWVRAEYVYGDTDSVFFKINCRETNPEKTPITGERNMKITIELSQEICSMVSKFLKQPHDFEYEKTFWPFILLSKKKYSGEKYETNPKKHKRCNMGNAAVKRDTAPITRDLLGRVTDILMKDKNMSAAIDEVNVYLEKLVAGKIPMDQFVITKSLNSSYKNPKQIAHKVLADRIAEREPGNKPTSGDRIPFVYIINPEKVRISKLKGAEKKNAPKILQGDCIEIPSYIKANADTCKIDYTHYISHQLMNPLSQLFALALEDIWKMKKKLTALRQFEKDLALVKEKFINDPKNKDLNPEELDEKLLKKMAAFREKKTAALIFDPFIKKLKNEADKNQDITKFGTFKVPVPVPVPVPEPEPEVETRVETVAIVAVKGTEPKKRELMKGKRPKPIKNQNQTQQSMTNFITSVSA